MKKLLLALAVVGVTLFTACTEECNHDFIEVDYSKDLVGTWTIVESDHACAYIFNADGTVSTTGVDGEGYWEDVKGTYSIVNNKITMNFESGYNIEGSFDLIPGHTFSFVDKTGRYIYNYCKEDLADEVVGMWVWVDSNGKGTENMGIQTFNADGTALFTGGYEEIDYKVNDESTYKVIGDLLIQHLPDQNPSYMTRRLTFKANGTATGDILTTYSPETNYTASWLRVKQSLDLADQKYDYIKTFVTNVKGEDKDINFMGYTFNFAKMDGSGLDKMLKALLFAVEFPDADHLNYSYQMNGNKETYKADIEVEGNTMTIKMSEKVATLKDVVLYAFQDADCSQMHFYMHKTAFVNFYTNMQAMLMEATDEQFDINNAEAVNAIYDNINNAVETINVSLVMSK